MHLFYEHQIGLFDWFPVIIDYLIKHIPFFLINGYAFLHFTLRRPHLHVHMINISCTWLGAPLPHIRITNSLLNPHDLSQYGFGFLQQKLLIVEKLKEWRFNKQKVFSEKFEKMVVKCLSKNPKKRPTAKQLLKISFFKKAREYRKV